jgi:mono/diheme cytochrome c family protein
MNAPLKVLLSCLIIVVALITIVFYRYDLIGNSATIPKNQTTETIDTPAQKPLPSSVSKAKSPQISRQTPAINEASIANGKKLFEEKTCVLCHGATGKADTPTGQAMKATNLTSGKFQHNDKNLEATAYIVKVIEEGVPGTAMASFKTQSPSEKDRKDLANYVHSLSGK